MILALATPDHQTRMWLFAASSASMASPKPIATLEWESGRALSDQLLARITTFLADNSAKLEDLTGILLLSGPGSFTSLRIGHAIGNALADSLQIPIRGLQGENWLYQGLSSIKDAPIGIPALPHYGAEANITRPKS
jgi:tRNA A37 threonylcarbamoyladenosine modification protein TsaB